MTDQIRMTVRVEGEHEDIVGAIVDVAAKWDDGGVGGTVQVQAMSEDQMEAAVLEVTHRYVDLDALKDVRARSEPLREEMRPLISKAIDDVIEKLGEGS